MRRNVRTIPPSNEQFRLLSADYNAEQKEIDEALPQKEERLEKLKSSAANVDAFIEKAKQSDYHIKFSMQF